MYYYAYINESKIATLIYAMPVKMSKEQGFIEISKEVYDASNAETEGSIIGMRWNEANQAWEEVTKYYYAVLIEKKFRKEVTEEDEARYFVKEVIESAEEINDPLYILIDGLDSVKVGQIYDHDTAGFQTPEFKEVAFADTDQVSVDGTNVVLTDKLAATDEAVKALETKVNEVKDQVENIDIPEVTATTILEKLKTVDGASSGIDADLLDGKDSTYFATTQGLQDLTTAVNGKAATNHTHNNYASTVVTTGSGNAITAISQSGNTITATKGGTYALSNHTHAGNCVVAYTDWNEETLSNSTEVNVATNAILGKQLGGWTQSDGYLVVPKTGNYLVALGGEFGRAEGSLSGSNELGVALSMAKTNNKSYMSTSGNTGAGEFQLLSKSITKVLPTVYSVVSLTAGEKFKFSVKAYSAYNNNELTCSIRTYGNIMLMEL